MEPEQPSRTAWGAALHRAAHQLLDGGRIFADPLALRILGPSAEATAREHGMSPTARGMRFFIAARAHFAETCLAEAVERRGVSQLVVLGAGLDTFAYRNPFEGRLAAFEVDHPTTQLWKRERLGEAGIAIPDSLTFAPVDFERQDLLDGLEAAGFEPRRRSFFIWLGVTFYLSAEAIERTLSAIAGLPGGGELVFDYSDPPERLSMLGRVAYRRLARRVSRAGEPFRSHFDPAELHARLRTLGFAAIEDLGPEELVERYLDPALQGAWRGTRSNRGGHVLFART